MADPDHRLGSRRSIAVISSRPRFQAPARSGMATPTVTCYKAVSSWWLTCPSRWRGTPRARGPGSTARFGLRDAPRRPAAKPDDQPPQPFAHIVCTRHGIRPARVELVGTTRSWPRHVASRQPRTEADGQPITESNHSLRVPAQVSAGYLKPALGCLPCSFTRL